MKRFPKTPLFVAFLAVAGCASSSSKEWRAGDLDYVESIPAVPWSPPPESEAARAAFAEARRMQGLGRAADAVQAALRAADADPKFLEAHRLLQDLTFRSTADAWLRDRYERRLAEHPDDADANYLLGRIEPDSGRQFELFSRAAALDPAHPYPSLGLAIGLARRGDVQGALTMTKRTIGLAPWLALPWMWLGGESVKRDDAVAAVRFFAAARDRAPDDARSFLGLAQAYDAMGERTQSSSNALEALRLAPGDEAVAGAAAESLIRACVPDDLDAGLGILDDAIAAGAPAAEVAALGGRLALANSRPVEAALRFERAIASGASPGDLSPPLRLSRILAGQFERAVGGAVAALCPEATSSDNLYAPRWARLGRAAAADLGRPRALLELAESMLSMGWIEEGRAVLVAARAAAPDDAVIAARVSSEQAFAAFVGELPKIARDARNAGSGGRPATTVEEVLARIAAASLRTLGTDAGEGAMVRHYPLLGTFAVSVASSGAFETTFGSHGLVCLVGARADGPVELVLGRIVVARASSKSEVLGESVLADECWIESEGLPPDVAGLKRGLAGLTMDRLVLLQLDALRHESRSAEIGLPFVRKRAATREQALSLDTPSAVAARIDAQLSANANLDCAVLDSVRRHELVHVYDAARLLPFSAHPFAALSLAIGSGLDGGATERRLEARAQALSILSAKEPRLALAGLVGFLPSREGDTPHAAAYREVAEAAVQIVYDHPREFPSVDRSYNVLQQFDLLTDAEVRELGRRLAMRL